jgi:hypothetical protein
MDTFPHKRIFEGMSYFKINWLILINRCNLVSQFVCKLLEGLLQTKTCRGSVRAWAYKLQLGGSNIPILEFSSLDPAKQQVTNQRTSVRLL